MGLKLFPRSAHAKILRGANRDIFTDFWIDSNLRMVVLSKIRHIVYRAGVTYSPRAMAERSAVRAGGGRSLGGDECPGLGLRAGVQGDAEPNGATARGRVRAALEYNTTRASHIF